ncbi:MAG TPA: peptide chain release factor 1, partial [Syntrophobacteraceae bacterium]|nr:peptide chain release factor 1 [Syntrophobacteraceae bacterium]
MFDKLESVVKRFQILESDLSNPELIARQKEYLQLAKEHAEIAPIVEAYQRLKRLHQDIGDNLKLLDEEQDNDMRELIREDIVQLRNQLERSEVELKLMLVPKDPNDDKNV